MAALLTYKRFLKRKMKKTPKTYTMSLKELMGYLEISEWERTCYMDLMLDQLAEDPEDHHRLEVICDGYSISSKMVREVTDIVEESPLTISKKKEENVVLDESDIQIVQALVLTRHHLQNDLKKFNISIAKN